MRTNVFYIIVLMVLLACNNDDDPIENSRVNFTYDFDSSTEGWMGDFADYPAGEEENYALDFGHSSLPESIDITQGALKLSGRNHSDDLFMFVKKEITGLTPNKQYRINFEVEFASNVADGEFGIGGSPGESVYIKAGATATEPQKIEDDLGWYRLNIDYGNQSEGGNDMIVLGNFANGTNENVYVLKTLSNSTLFLATSGNNGTLWLLVGTDSGFEGETTIYINKIKVELF